MYEEWLDILKKCQLFKEINNRELYMLLECLRPRIYSHKKGDTIAIDGERFEGIGIILKGSAAVTKESASGTRVIMTIVSPSNMFGEIAAFSKSRTWPATVVAQDNCTVMFLPPDKIINHCELMCISHNTLVNNMLEIVSDKALMLNKKVEYLTIKSLRSKISSFLLEQHKKAGNSTFMMPMKRNELADFLNVSRPSLSREMCRMRDEGIIDFHRESIRIHDMESLKSMAE